jgi:uncharacterized OB-fold protein
VSADWGLTPVADDPETAPLFAGAAEGHLMAQHCAECAGWQHPPRPRCVSCRAESDRWDVLPGKGRVHTWTVVEHQISPQFPVPYTVVLVDVVPEPGHRPLRFLGHLDGRPELSAGDPVSVVFRERGGVVLPDWELDAPPT